MLAWFVIAVHIEAVSTCDSGVQVKLRPGWRTKYGSVMLTLLGACTLFAGSDLCVSKI